jgi:hypothetical protein
MKVEGGQPFRNYWAGETKEYEQALEAVTCAGETK